jgi:hypothetical protein
MTDVPARTGNYGPLVPPAPPPPPATAPSFIVYAPGVTSPTPPVFADWAQIETVVNALEGAARVVVDQTGLPGFAHVPSTANLDGRGRLELVGGGPNGEAEIVIDDGGQIRNVREWRTLVVRASPTVRSSIVYDLGGLIVDATDATFLFQDATATLPVIQGNVPGSYLSFLFALSSELRNSHNPGKAVFDTGPNATIFLTIGSLFFPSPFDDTISGPASTALGIQLDSTLPPSFPLPAFLGPLTFTQIAAAPGVAYTPASVPNWNGTAPATVQEALDRIAAKIGPIP